MSMHTRFGEVRPHEPPASCRGAPATAQGVSFRVWGVRPLRCDLDVTSTFLDRTVRQKYVRRMWVGDDDI